MEAEPPGHAFPGRAWEREVWRDSFSTLSFETVSGGPSLPEFPSVRILRKMSVAIKSTSFSHIISRIPYKNEPELYCKTFCHYLKAGEKHFVSHAENCHIISRVQSFQGPEKKTKKKPTYCRRAEGMVKGVVVENIMEQVTCHVNGRLYDDYVLFGEDGSSEFDPESEGIHFRA
jgi:hypothetical protein